MVQSDLFRQANAQADLLALVGGGLRKVASSQGGEYAGPCPVCGGTDRFHVQPQAEPPRWLCRRCSGGQWRRAVDFVMLRDGVSALEAAKRLKGATPLQLPPFSRTKMGGAEEGGAAISKAKMGGEEWGEAAIQAVGRAVEALWSPAGAAARAWLAQRGLAESSLNYFLLGWSNGLQLEGIYLPPGVVIPWLEAGERVRMIKVALLPGQSVRCEGCQKMATARQPCPLCGRVAKYRGVKGNRSGGIFNAEELALGRRDVLFVEGEFDCISAWQAGRDRLAIVSLGSAGGRIDLAEWFGALATARRVFCIYDNAPAGLAGRQALDQALGGALQQRYLPEGVKDVNDYLLGGGRLEALGI